MRETNWDWDDVLAKKPVPPFKPPKDHLNCDPSLELEEMIVEAKPLHKKKKRLAKQRSIQRDTDIETTFIKEFPVYNRYKEVHRREMEQKELEWEKELEIAMANSEVSTVVNLKTVVESSTAENSKTASPANSSPVPPKCLPQLPPPEPAEVSQVTAAPSSSMAAAGTQLSTGEESAGPTSGNEEAGAPSGAGDVIDYFIDRTPSPNSSA